MLRTIRRILTQKKKKNKEAQQKTKK